MKNFWNGKSLFLLAVLLLAACTPGPANAIEPQAVPVPADTATATAVVLSCPMQEGADSTRVWDAYDPTNQFEVDWRINGQSVKDVVERLFNELEWGQKSFVINDITGYIVATAAIWKCRDGSRWMAITPYTYQTTP